MKGKAWASALAVATMVLSGCIGGGEEPAPVEDLSANDTLPQNATVAPDGRGDISAFKETNKTEMGAGGIMHAHDHWAGKERLDGVAWIDSGLIPLPVLPCKGEGCTVGGSSNTYPPGTAIADYDLAPPPEMGMVYEGTKQVELKLVKLTGLVDEAPPNPAGKVFFDYLAANDEPGQFRTGGELKLNEPFLIDIEPTDADMPHQTKSLWIFRIYSNTEMVTFGFNITVSLIRGYDVVDWPPHPDLYADRPTRVVYEGPQKLASKGSIDSLLFGSDAGWLHPEKVISWGTDQVEVTVSNVVFTPDTPVAPPPKGFVFEYHNASKPPLLGNGEPGVRLEDPASDGKTFHFLIDLKDDRGDAYDTPYAQYSRWGFRLVPYWEQATGTCVDELFWPGLLVGCQWYGWTATYDIKVEAHGRSTAGGAPEAVG